MPVVVNFTWEDSPGDEKRYRFVLEADGSMVIEQIDGQLRAWGRWDELADVLTIERIRWLPKSGQPISVDVGSLARAAARALIDLPHRS